MATTQKEIAKALGMSQSRVASALAGYADVSEATRERVQAAAQELGYTQYSNQSARGLIARRYNRRAATGIVAVLQPSKEHGLQRGVPYFDPYFSGIEQAADAAGLDAFVCRPRNGALPRLVQECGVDGVVSFDRGNLQGLCALNMPFVTLDIPQATLEGLPVRSSSVLADDASGIRQIVRHLAKLGHTRIAYLGHDLGADIPPRHLQSGIPARRFRAFREALAEAGLDFDPRLVEADFKSSSMYDAVDGTARLLARDIPFSALVCHNDPMAMGAVRRLTSVGLRVPEDISVTGFDNISEASSFTPRVTSVASSRMDMGRRAVELLLEHIADPDCEPRQEEFPVELAIGETTAAPRNSIEH